MQEIPIPPPPPSQNSTPTNQGETPPPPPPGEVKTWKMKQIEENTNEKEKFKSNDLSGSSKFDNSHSADIFRIDWSTIIGKKKIQIKKKISHFLCLN